MTALRWLGRLAAGIVLACLVAAAGPPPQQQRTAPPEQRTLPGPAEARVALVVGNSAYQHTTALANPLHDARDLAAALERTGFDVIVAIDAGKAQMDGALRAFADKLAKADVALFFYAGHGLQVGQQNFLVPVDAQLQRERDLEFEAVRLEFVLRQMEIDREGKTTIVMLDACRDNPLARNLARSMGTRSAAIGQGLAPASTGVGTFIAYSTQPGNVALDGTGRNSPFTAALLGHIGSKGRNLNATMIEVRKDVIKTTGGRQVPWDHSALTGDFYFVPGQAVAGGTMTPAPAAKSDDVEALKARLAVLEAAQAKPGGTSQGRAPGPDPAKLQELRTRVLLEQEKAKELQTKLLEARRIEGQASDPAERQRLLQASMRIQGDMTRASLNAKRLKEELAALETPAATTTTPAQAGPGRATFTVTAEQRTLGDELPLFPSTANCESRCQSDAKCVAYNLSKDGVCELLSGVTRTVAASNWRTGSREGTSTTGATPPIPPVLAKPKANASVANFDEADNVRIEGVTLGAATRAPSPAACRDACDKAAGCVAFQHGRKIPVMGQCQLFSSVATRQEDQAWRSGVRVAGATTAMAAAGSWQLPVSRSKQGFDFYEGASFIGDLIKDNPADSADACMVVCRNTVRCIAAQFIADTRRCGAYGSVGARGTQSNVTVIVRSQP